MGWNVNVAVKSSAVHGSGVFAAEPIAAGTKVWQFDASMQVCSRRRWPGWSRRRCRRALTAGYVHEPSGLFLWYRDGMQFMNHGDGRAANVGLHYWPKLRDDHIVALRDIEPGEELREDYRSCLRAGLAPDHWLAPFYRAHCPAHYRFLLGLIAAEKPSYPVVVAESGAKLLSVATSASRKTGFDEDRAEPAGQTGGVNFGADVRGNRDDGGSMTTRAPPDLRGGGEAVEPRHVQVEEDEPRLQPVRHLHALGAVRRNHRLVAALLQHRAQDQGICAIVLDDQDDAVRRRRRFLLRDRFRARFQLKPHRIPPLAARPRRRAPRRRTSSPSPARSKR